MHAWHLTGTTLDSLQRSELPTPRPGPGEVLVQVDAASVNYRDYALAIGEYLPQMPRPVVPLSDGVGRIAALGAGVDGWREGERVTGLYTTAWLDGPFRAQYHASKLGGPVDGWGAEYVRLPAAAVLRVPEYLDDAEASTLPVSGLTAWTALQRIPHGPGARVLVQGTGSVSLMALQLAVAAGAEVIATTRGDEKAALLRAMGAAAVIDYAAESDLAAAIRARSDGRGVDGIVDVVGGSQLLTLLEAAADNAHVAIVGFLQGMRVEGNLIGPVMAHQLNIHGVSVGSRADFEAFLAALQRHRIRPVVGERFDFGHLDAAVASIAGARGIGKPVVTMRRND